MVEEILGAVREGKRVCAVYYGHPGVYVEPSHEAVRRARGRFESATMLPAALRRGLPRRRSGRRPRASGLAELGGDQLPPHSFRPDPTAGLVLWQVDGIGKLDWNLDPDPRGLQALAEVAGELYPPEHELVFYRASIYPVPGESGAHAVARLATLDSPRRRRSTCRRCRADRSMRPWPRGSASRLRSRELELCAGAFDGDNVPLRLVELDALLNALARLVGAAS